ncbi:amidohydrolase [Robiginitomaculum antarcticum]|uniref:amidohydrolase n=1 Tax=Robiginitomaculum antarcticum TaxID=437507 RepID=UPI00037DD0AC|nr:amidohydrolase [Robiginitomaculum antarcticum]
MKLSYLLFSAAITFSACTSEVAVEDIEKLPIADLYITADGIYSGNVAQADLRDIAVADGKIICVSTDLSCAGHSREKTQSAIFKGYVYPGFTDAHAHLRGIGERELTLNLEGTMSVTDLVGRTTTHMATLPEDSPVMGRGWIETHWPENRFPTREDLDQISTDRAIILSRADGHASVVNSKALELAGITVEMQAPFGGDILRGLDGRPTGMLIDTAQGLLADIIPTETPERRRAAYIRAGDVYADYGWTGIHNMSADPDDVSIMTGLSDEGQMPLRIYNAMDYTGSAPDVLSADARADDQLVTTRAIKLYVDGALGSRGAALLEPYDDDPQNRGLIMLDKDEALEIYTMALREGVQVSTHAIGDRGNRLVLDWYEEAFNAVPESERRVVDPRWRVEHAQILNLDDLDRFAAIGVIPSMQPSHAIGDLHFAPARIGIERLKGGYSWQSLINSGTIVAGGSDAPVERGDPRIEFYAAVARKDQNGFTGEGWYPEEAVSRLNALKMFTAWPAYASFQEDNLGTIEVGKVADFTVFNGDIMTIDEAEILSVEPVATVLGGKVIMAE